MIPKITLNNGQTMPLLGLGVYDPQPNQNLVEAIGWALEMGYRLIDTATIYKNEAEVGRAMSENGLSRNDIFLTTKVWTDDMGYDQTLRAFEQSLKKLNTDYVDLYLIHWPEKTKRRETWRALERIYEQGGAKSIGVSNYYQPHLEELFTYANIKPAVNQFELSPYCYLPNELSFCKSQNIVVQGYAPVVRGQKADDKRLIKIAKKYNKSTFQVLIRWGLQHGAATIPKSVTKNRLQENMEVFDFEILDEDMKTMNTFFDDTRVAWNPMTFL